MEKQRSFSIKPIRYLAFSFTISFSLIFLIFFPTWVFKSTPSRTQYLDFNTTSLTVQSLNGFNNSSSEYVLKNPILMGAHLGKGQNSSQIAEISSFFPGPQKRVNSSLTPFGKNPFLDSVNASYSSKSNVDSIGSNNTDEYVLKNPILMGAHLGKGKNSSQIAEISSYFSGPQRRVNSSLTPFGKNPFLDSVNASYGSKSSVGSVGSNNTDEGFQELNGGGDVLDNSSFGEQGISFDGPNISIRNNIEVKNEVECDITKGRWVIDERYPLYTNITCPFIDEGFNCQGNGRLDKDYMKWRWQPQDCDIPRFNATKMLELIRGKRLVFVGDSINRNQWESMLCLLMGAVKDPKKVYEVRGRKITKEKGNYCFKFEDYKCTVEFYVSHFLVHESKARIGSKRKQTLRIDTMDKGSSRWRGADILVFNTAHWWSHHKTKAGINYYQEGDQVHPRLDVTEAFKRALLTWASWVDKYINPHKTRIFFRSSSPSHFSGGLWNTGGHCKEAYRPINETFTSNYPEKNSIVEEIISQMKNPVTFLNITRLSDYRPDAHPSKYGRKSVNPGVQDCSHWCLPGVPDNWNELLYYYLQLRTKATFL